MAPKLYKNGHDSLYKNKICKFNSKINLKNNFNWYKKLINLNLSNLTIQSWSSEKNRLTPDIVIINPLRVIENIYEQL